MEKKQNLHGNARSMVDKRSEAHQEAQNVAKDIRNSTHVFARTVKQNPLTSDNLQKVQMDRWYTYSHSHPLFLPSFPHTYMMKSVKIKSLLLLIVWGITVKQLRMALSGKATLLLIYIIIMFGRVDENLNFYAMYIMLKS